MAQTNPRSKSYPIAETFTSVQGEGIYTGTLMHFIRLAGCNVGRYDYDEIHQRGASEEKIVQGLNLLDEPLAIERQHSVCESILGTRFLCDTNYHKCYDATAAELIERAGLVEHICITGGEPFLHDLEDLITHAAERLVHIETSGTKPIPWLRCSWRRLNSWSPKIPEVWITCSPKAGFLAENIPLIDEFKFVVSSAQDIRSVAALCEKLGLEGTRIPIYLQPVNWVTQVNSAGIDMVVSQLEYYPTFRLSAQLHKYLGVR